MSAKPPSSPRPRSLRARLTWRLVVLQVLTLAIFALLSAIPISRFGNEPVLDHRPLSLALRHLERDGEALRLEPGRWLAQVIAEHPDFWYHIRDAEGRSLEYGQPPAMLQPLFDNLQFLIWADFVLPGAEGEPLAQVRREDSPVGTVWVATGGGPSLSPFSFGLMIVNSYFIAIAALMTLATVIGTPILIRRSMRGVNEAAAEAEAIDVDQRGARLSGQDVPAEIQGLVRAVNAALARLDEGFERRQRFLADAAHELRTPIAVLATRIQLMPQGPDRDQLSMDVARLSNLADQLLDLQRLDNDTARPVRLDLAALAGEVASDLAPLAIASGHEIAFDAPPAPVPVLADRHALIRVVSNLIQNAITHSGRGAAIEVAVDRAPGGPATLRVRDTGPGVPAQDRARLFEPFYRVASQGQGAGLGLHLAREVVTRLDGTIHVTDAPGGGAEFIVRLPVAKA